MTTAAVIVAAGRGSRAGGPLPKQWQPLAGRMVADWTRSPRFAPTGIDRIVLVLHPDELDRAAAFPGVEVGGGRRDPRRLGPRRARALRGTADHVLIHDVARPLVSPR
jgi:2-C-methyl-D-erythritol 4-phosphate cytidylyltransferase/2-C-methyl-D-erythritol 2,4-cyclodiphosphate synthase